MKRIGPVHTGPTTTPSWRPDLDARLDRERDRADEIVTTDDDSAGQRSLAERRASRLGDRGPSLLALTALKGSS